MLEFHRYSAECNCSSRSLDRIQASQWPLLNRLAIPLPRRPSLQFCTKTIIPPIAQGHFGFRRNGRAHTCPGKQPQKDGATRRRQSDDARQATGPESQKVQSDTTAICCCIGNPPSKQSCTTQEASVTEQYDIPQRTALELRYCQTFRAACVVWQADSEGAALESGGEGEERVARQLRDGTKTAKKHEWAGVRW